MHRYIFKCSKIIGYPFNHEYSVIKIDEIFFRENFEEKRMSQAFNFKY